MKVAAYYSYQAAARGHLTPQDVERDARIRTPLYDRILLPWLPAAKTALIHEVACGSGIVLHWLKSRGYTHVSGSDSSEPQVALARTTGFPVALADFALGC